MYRLLVLPLVAAAACAAIHASNSAIPMQPGPLEMHVARLRQLSAAHPEMVGKIPRDLTVPERDAKPWQPFVETDRLVETAPPFASDPYFDFALGYAGVTDDQICFVRRQYIDAQTEPAAQIAEWKKAWDGNAWVLAVDSLDALKGPAWPPPPAAHKLGPTSVDKDAVETRIQKRQTESGYVDVKRDDRVVTYKQCGPKPELAPTTRFVVVVVHSPDAATTYDEGYQADFESRYHRSFKDEKSMEGDDLYVWALTADGVVDLR